MSFDNPKYFNSREISWVDFNQRVLDEAADRKNPLLERLRFLGISQDNLDEFVNVRVATLLKKIKENEPADAAGNTPAKQLEIVREKIQQLVHHQGHIYNQMLKPQLAKKGIKLLKWNELDTKEENYFENLFEEQIFPTIQPITVDDSKTLPFLANDSINFIIQAKKSNKLSRLILPLPEKTSRVLKIPGKTNQFILVEDVMANFLSRYFPGQRLEGWALFKITRYMDFDINDQNAKKYKAAVVKTLEERAHGSVIRLETTKASSQKLVNWLMNCYNLKTNDVFYLKTPLELTFVNQLINQVVGFKDLLFEKVIPYDPALLQENQMMDLINKHDLLVHHPYDSFKPVLRFIDQAAVNTNVTGISMTLYRVSKNSPIIKSLLKAASNGKKVTIMIELKARSDEANNLKWADELEIAGCRVLYGIPGLKVHSKLCLVTTVQDNQHIYYTHLATGNYHDKTAKLYTDFGLFTANQAIGQDAAKIFQFLAGEVKKPTLKKLVLSPNGIRNELIKKIDNEIANAKQGLPSGIRMKMNSLSDTEMIEKLYEANAAGVKVDLIIRGICNLRTGIKGVSDLITVHSIVGRLLEHSRVYLFENAGKPLAYLSSADLMKRNLSRRVEILFPILNPILNQQVQKIFNDFMKDNVKARNLKANDQWRRISHRGIKSYNVQDDLINRREEIMDSRLNETGFTTK